jgi:uncharacterized membrane protein (Fun14 family)
MMEGFFEKLTRSFDKPASWYVEMAGYLIAGFIFGFLVKYGGRLFFLLLIGAGLALWALDYLQVLTVNYSTLKSLLGLSADSTLQSVLTGAVDWVKAHVIESLAALLGFILAWKLA